MKNNIHLMFGNEGIEIIKEKMQYHLIELKKAEDTLSFAGKLRDKYPYLKNRKIKYLTQLEKIKVEVHAQKVTELADLITGYGKHHDVKEIKANHNIVKYIGDIVQLKKRGNRFIGLCPFHNEKTPSFTVYDDSYFCFGCQASGDIITFIMNYEKLNFNQALTKLL